VTESLIGGAAGGGKPLMGGGVLDKGGVHWVMQCRYVWVFD